jgi:uncharacterized protein involved in exopolysaccharide biosynthesis
VNQPEDTGPPPATGLVIREPSTQLVADVQLVIVNGQGVGRTFPLYSEEVIIGRSPKAQVRLEDNAISGQHAKIVRDNGNYWLLDLGSTNGTFVNGQPVTAKVPAQLSVGDSVQVAETVLALLPAGAREGMDQTQYLSRLLPRVPDASALGMMSAGGMGNQNSPELQLIAKLLEGGRAEEEPPPPTLEERIEKVLKFLRMLKRYWVPLLAVVAICTLAASATAFLWPPLSEASFRIRISPRPEDKEADPESLEFFTVVEQNFLNPSLVQKTLSNLGKPTTQAQVMVTHSALRFDSVAHMTYLGLFQSRDPNYAVAFLKQHVENYLDAELRRTLHVMQAETDFLSARVKEREAELRKTEELLKEFKSKHLAGLPEYAGQQVTSREALLSRRAELSAQVSKSSFELELARKRLKEESPALSRKVESALPFEQSMSDAKRRLAEARAKGLGDQHPEVMSLNKQIADFQRLADQARSTQASAIELSSNPALAALRHRVGDLEVQTRGAGAELGAINSQIERLNSIVNTMPEVEAKYAQLTRSYTVNKEMYAQLFEQLRQGQLKLELARTSALARYEVISPPESQGVPLTKALRKRTVIGLGVGLLLGALIVAIAELRRFLKTRKRAAVAAAPGTALAVVAPEDTRLGPPAP